MSRLTLALGTLLAMVVLTACNTVQGIGKDVAKGGQAIERAAK